LAITLPNPATILDGREFRTFMRDYREPGSITVHATDEDIDWAAGLLGQTVPGRRGDRVFNAVVVELETSSDHEGLITVVLL
jgi:hypothetical protein